LLNCAVNNPSTNIFSLAEHAAYAPILNFYLINQFNVNVCNLLQIVIISVFPFCIDLLKGIFFEVKKKFETALSVLKKEKITIDPDDPTAVAGYAQVMRTVREK
jgi:hypothetical protein